ncbi:unnamed protein product [Spirodela intermedia]|uniref:BHLH domain-containing protein n=1 Tax=Spirodela intermedia TaxID=51605 RepID=A0A7I8IWU7_SPIIN|nr:unnamed protein product [Spirodela intermedia]CAA6662164.1 unnamed protein product [Spirodela intermedia]
MNLGIYGEPGYLSLHARLHSLLGEVAVGGGDNATAEGGGDDSAREDNLQGKRDLSGFFSPCLQIIHGEAAPDAGVYCNGLPLFLAANCQERQAVAAFDLPPVQMDLGNQQEYGLFPCSAAALSGGYNGHSSSPLLGFWPEMKMEMEMAIEKRRGDTKGNNTTEKQRRGKMSEKFSLLRSLIPHPRKHDRASIVAEATEYIKELLRTVEELQTLLAARRRRVEEWRNPTAARGGGGHPPPRCSWVQRRLRGISVDVRIVEDEVVVRLLRRGGTHCLLLLSRALLDLQLDLLHLAAGNIGDSHVIVINCKIEERSSVYGSAIAKKLVEALEGTAPVAPF